jgi:hypothetical protein
MTESSELVARSVGIGLAGAALGVPHCLPRRSRSRGIIADPRDCASGPRRGCRSQRVGSPTVSDRQRVSSSVCGEFVAKLGGERYRCRSARWRRRFVNPTDDSYAGSNPAPATSVHRRADAAVGSPSGGPRDVKRGEWCRRRTRCWRSAGRRREDEPSFATGVVHANGGVTAGMGDLSVKAVTGVPLERRVVR